MKYTLFTALILWLVCNPFVFSQSEEKIKELSEDIVQSTYAVPKIPALEIISADPNTIARPTTAREFATSLYNAIDATGNVKQGLAFEIKPNYIFKEPIDLNNYQNNKMAYMLENTQISIATVATSGDSSSTDLSWGIRIVIFDKTDPMVNQAFTQAVAQQFLAEAAPENPDTSDGDVEVGTLASILNRYQLEFAAAHWNDSWLMVAYAGGTRLSGSNITQGKIVGHRAWLAGGLKLGHYGQLGYQASWSRELKTESTQYFNELGLSSRLTLQLGKPTINFYAEASYQPLLNKDDFKNNPEVNVDKSFVWSSGFEFKVSNGLWATAGLGKDAERIAGQDNIQILSGLRLGFSDKQRLQPQ